MTGKFRPIIQYTLFLIFIPCYLISCTRQPTKITPTYPQTTLSGSPTTAPTKTPTHTSTLDPTVAPTSTPEPLTLTLAHALPPDIIEKGSLRGIGLSDDPNAPLWFGPADGEHHGELIQTATWVYALAAPFPTLLDEIRLVELQAFWSGKRPSIFASVTKLYVPETLIAIWDSQWGQHSGLTVSPYEALPSPDTLWEENAWVIVPFESLVPKLKVIHVDGISPLFKDFDLDNYPLKVIFQLFQNPTFAEEISEGDIQSLVNAIRPTNRDPQKMTSLVMTGVTALVRATAYRMEINGVTYPGEGILDWLTEADLTHISNEVSFYEDCPPPDPSSGKLLFCSDPKYIELFDYIGADIIELTGNHNNDALYMYGVDVVPFTLDLYDQYGMKYFGGGRNLSEAQSPLLIDHNGNRLGFIGCNAFGPDFAWATEIQGGAAPCNDYQWMVDEIRRLKNEGYLPIATLQYYEDYYNTAGEHHIRDFGRLAEAGAVIVNGSQAHRPKAMSFNHDAYIDYGLGNLFFDQRWYIDDDGNVIEQTSWEIIQRHTFYDGSHLNTELLTAKLVDFAQPRPMTKDERTLFLEELFEASGWNPR